jgi:hypothetical protein
MCEGIWQRVIGLSDKKRTEWRMHEACCDLAMWISPRSRRLGIGGIPFEAESKTGPISGWGYVRNLKRIIGTDFVSNFDWLAAVAGQENLVSSFEFHWYEFPVTERDRQEALKVSIQLIADFKKNMDCFFFYETYRSRPPGPTARTVASGTCFSVTDEGKKIPDAVFVSALTRWTRIRSSVGFRDEIDRSEIDWGNEEFEPDQWGSTFIIL